MRPPTCSRLPRSFQHCAVGFWCTSARCAAIALSRLAGGTVAQAARATVAIKAANSSLRNGAPSRARSRRVGGAADRFRFQLDLPLFGHQAELHGLAAGLLPDLRHLLLEVA